MTFLVLLTSSAVRADILFDIDPNVPDLLSAEVTEAPTIPPGEPMSLWQERANLGWDWTVITLRPIPAGTFDLSHLTVSARSSLATKITVEFDINNATGSWSGPPIGILDGEIYSFDTDWRRVQSLQYIFLSPEPGQNELILGPIQLIGTANIIPEPHSAVVAVAALAALALRCLIARRAKRGSATAP